MNTLTAPQPATRNNSGDDDIHHLYCCDPNIAMCGVDLTNRYCACHTWRPYTKTRRDRTPRRTATAQPTHGRDPAVYDRLEPCPSRSAQLRHLAKAETCATCDVEGAS